ncbi:threonine synthase [Salmonella enterica subsp. enterica serovar Enteritidis str. EC20110358]|nr:threonine synthase [Salmonella enterica subsp. enterica serovar Enteritidis str. EC20110358]
MKLYNLKDHNEQVSFAQAVTQGLGKQQGLFFPHELPEFSLTEIDEMLNQDFVSRSAKILSAFIGDEIPQQILEERVRAAFAFPAPVAQVESDVGCLELFHGPTLAFKDFGGRFMAQMLTHISGDKPVTILTATSGDTGAAVAHAFYGLENVRVVILYPRGKISPLQEKLFCTLGGNIETVAIDGDFDACQALVKQAFDDEELKTALGLNSANSINISRLLAQICYYFEAVAQLPQGARNQLVISVPSGNFGDLTAGLLAKSLGLPVKRFKDFGGRFMAQMLTHISGDKPVTILTATSGDTGAAVAHAFYGLENVRVVILYPRGKISPLQEKLFCTLGGNIETVAIDGDFDACQALVKQAFDDEELKTALGLNSANSINISRLLAQICYYFEAVAQLPQGARNQLVISVPSGNFGDLTAGLLAKSLGLPVKRFIAATNINDTVPRFLQDGKWAPKATQATLSNAMDVSQPNNWPRVEELFRRKIWRLTELGYAAVDDTTTQQTMRELKAKGYISEPHAAVAYRALRDQLNPGEYGLFLGTAHPAKFKESVESILGETLALPEALAERADLPLLSHHLPADFAALRKLMMTRQ